MNKEVERLRDTAEGQGFTVLPTGGNHLRWIPPDGGPYVITASTPSDRRSLLNMRSALRRAGLRLPRKDGRPA